MYLFETESGTKCSSPLSHLFESSRFNKTEDWLLQLAKYIDVWDLQRSKVFLGQSSLSFIDDCTRVPRVYLMKQKLDVSTIFSVFYKMMSV